MIEVVPAIIPKSHTHLSEQVEKVFTYVSRIQVDIMDGKYTPSTSWPYSDTDNSAFQKLVDSGEMLPHTDVVEYELDMMVERPEEHIDEWIRAGFKTLIIHIESTEKLDEIIETAKEREIAIGLAFKPSTSLEGIKKYVDRVAFVQCMGNDKIGYHGVSLDSAVLLKISQLRAMYRELIISIDIGVTKETAQVLVDRGVSKLVSGSAIYGSEDIKTTIETFKHLSI